MQQNERWPSVLSLFHRHVDNGAHCSSSCCGHTGADARMGQKERQSC